MNPTTNGHNRLGESLNGVWPQPIGDDKSSSLSELVSVLIARLRVPALLDLTLDHRGMIVQLSIKTVGQVQAAAKKSEDQAETIRSGTTPLESDILEAAVEGPMNARDLAERAGYRLNSHFRTVLARLRRRGLLSHDDAGYHLTSTERNPHAHPDREPHHPNRASPPGPGPQQG